MDFTPSARTRDYAKRIRKFMRQRIRPVEEAYMREMAAPGRSRRSSKS
jgi:hypothetical protein